MRWFIGQLSLHGCQCQEMEWITGTWKYVSVAFLPISVRELAADGVVLFGGWGT